MIKGVTLGWIVNPLTGQRVFDAAAVARLTKVGARCARFAFDLGGHTSWDAGIVAVYQGFLDDLLAAGITPIGLVSNGAVPGPHNQQTDWNANSKEVGNGTGTNTFQKAYVQSLQALVAAFPRVTTWELWNEPNAYNTAATTSAGATSYSGSSFMYPSCYAALLTQACPLVPASATIVTGGLFAHNDTFSGSGAQYLYDLYTAGGWNSYNMPFGAPPHGTIGAHLYPNSGGALATTMVASIMRQIDRAVSWFENPPKRLPRTYVITEAGWQSSDVGLLVQADNLTLMAGVLGTLPSITAWCWFTLDDNPGAGQSYGLYDTNHALKRSGDAFSVL